MRATFVAIFISAPLGSSSLCFSSFVATAHLALANRDTVGARERISVGISSHQHQHRPALTEHSPVRFSSTSKFALQFGESVALDWQCARRAQLVWALAQMRESPSVELVRRRCKHSPSTGNNGSSLAGNSLAVHDPLWFARCLASKQRTSRAHVRCRPANFAAFVAFRRCHFACVSSASSFLQSEPAAG